MMNDDVLKILISEEEIEKRVKELGRQISDDYAGKSLVVVSVLKGSVMFMADLLRALPSIRRSTSWLSAVTEAALSVRGRSRCSRISSFRSREEMC